MTLQLPQPQASVVGRDNVCEDLHLTEMLFGWDVSTEGRNDFSDTCTFITVNRDTKSAVKVLQVCITYQLSKLICTDFKVFANSYTFYPWIEFLEFQFLF